MTVLSIQSAVAYGHVGNSAALFPLQRLGVEAWPIDTVHYSNHPGHGAWQGAAVPPETIRAQIDGLDRVGALAKLDGLLTGYLGSAETGAAALDALVRARANGRDVLYLCDPVMGETATGLYVAADLPAFFATRALPVADIVTPNTFELGLLADRPVATIDDAIAAAGILLARGPRLIAVTGLAAGTDMACLMVTAAGAWAVRTPRLTLAPTVHGAGDALAALLLAHLLAGKNPAESLSLAVSALWGILAATATARAPELALVAAQDQIVHPTRLFAADPLPGIAG